MNRFVSPFFTLALLLPISLSAIHPTITELRGRPFANPGASSVGASVALSDRFILVGAPTDDLAGSGRGAAQVFDARTGRHLRRIECPDTVSPTANFGISVAVDGHLGLVGANNAFGNRGAAYLFDLRNGNLLRTFQAQDTMTSINLGDSVSLQEGLVLVGATNYGVATAPNGQGAAYLFDLATGNQLEVLQPPDGHTSMRFGSAVAVHGRLGLIGAYGDNDAGSQSGSAYLFDLESREIVSKLTESDAAGGRRFGGRVALHGLGALISGDAGGSTSRASWFDLSQADTIMTETQRMPMVAGVSFGNVSNVALEGDVALVGYRSDNTAVLFDARNGVELSRFFLGNGQFGGSVALSGGRAVIGARSYDGASGTSGAAFLAQPLSYPLPAERLASLNDSAPGLVESRLTGFVSAAISSVGFTSFHGRAGRASGAWLHQNAPLLPFPLTFTGAQVPLTSGANELFFGSVQRLVGQAEINGIVDVLLSGPGASRQSNRALVQAINWIEEDSKIFFRSGQEISDWSNAQVSGWQDVVLSLDAGSLDKVAVGVQLRRGAASVDKTNDSGVLGLSISPSVDNTDHREGELAPDGAEYGQFLGRVAHGASGVFAFPVFCIEDGDARLTLWTSTPNRIVRQGDSAPGLPPLTTNLVVAETIGSVIADPLFRYTLRGGPSRENEALFHEGVGLIQQKGGGIPGMVERTIVQRLLGFWPVHEDAVIYLVKLAGSGVNRSNDVALVMRLEDGEYLTLVREGEELPDAPGARIGVIQRVDVDPVGGHYVVQVSLTGEKARNQALLSGHARAGNATLRQALRLPRIDLRKGTLYQAAPSSAITRLRSLNLGQKTDKGGAGGKGLGQSINDSGQYVLEVQFDNKARTLIRGGD